MSRIAVLSNVNMNLVIRMLGKEAEVYQAEGYGNELGTLMNPASSYHAFAPEYTFLIMDLMELLEHELEPETAKGKIQNWFGGLEAALKPEVIYYVSDAYLWGVELAAVFEPGRKAALEQLWQQELEELCRRHGNVRMLPYRHLIESMGETTAFSMKMWYMGKILLSNEAQKLLCGLILEKLKIETRTPKKLLVLDLDNTLWGGLAGENDITPIELSEDHTGLAYKNLQRVILQMQRQGVLLAIVSKNNEQDAMEILEHHPHMVLRSEAFAAKRINWQPKQENIRDIARELNLGTDSFVFWDDNPTERELIKEMLPEVAVPDFPDKPEKLAPAMVEIYKEYFAKSSITEEDRKKTAQYAANSARQELERKAGSFEDYLKQLEIVMTRVNPEKHMERLTQLVNKTNQFNLTTKRYTQGQMAEILQDEDKRVYLYSVADRFGDNGIVAAVIVNLGAIGAVSKRVGSGKTATDEGFLDLLGLQGCPVVEEFVMSCRVMGKNIEYAIMEDVEADLRESGYAFLRGMYLPTAKNQPVAELYDRLGYRRLEAEECGNAGKPESDGNVCGNTGKPESNGNVCGEPTGRVYEIELSKAPKRLHQVKVIREA